MKILKYLAFLTLFNLAIISIISSSVKSESSILSLTTQKDVITTPTPIIVVKKVIKKIFKTPVANTKIAILPQKDDSITVKNNIPPAVSQTITVTPPPANPTQQASNNCVITIDGASYDVTSFRSRHSGGNVFNCGSDMSQIFWSRHGQSQLSFMQQFRI